VVLVAIIVIVIGLIIALNPNRPRA